MNNALRVSYAVRRPILSEFNSDWRRDAVHAPSEIVFPPLLDASQLDLSKSRRLVAHF